LVSLGINLGWCSTDMSLQAFDVEFVRRLVSGQFPQWAPLAVRAVQPGGWDNASFRLGERMVVRLPRSAAYAAQVEKEHRWLPALRPFLPLQIPVPVALGEPAHGYPWKWSIYEWIEGETAAAERIADLNEFAIALAHFIAALQQIDPLTKYDAEMRDAIAILRGKIDEERATRIWERALGMVWEKSPVWVHGDVSPGNLLVQAGRLTAVIDFGMLGVGDPACDLSIAWTLFGGESRETFRAMIPLDPGTWLRGSAWALWKAMIVAAGLSETTAVESSRSWSVIEHVLGCSSVDA
jgi:aminoglycoside phosphotransferase (APT) family kinase protein